MNRISSGERASYARVVVFAQTSRLLSPNNREQSAPLAIVLALFALTAPARAQSNLIPNGSFANGSFTADASGFMSLRSGIWPTVTVTTALPSPIATPAAAPITIASSTRKKLPDHESRGQRSEISRLRPAIAGQRRASAGKRKKTK